MLKTKLFALNDKTRQARVKKTCGVVACHTCLNLHHTLLRLGQKIHELYDLKVCDLPLLTGENSVLIINNFEYLFSLIDSFVIYGRHTQALCSFVARSVHVTFSHYT